MFEMQMEKTHIIARESALLAISAMLAQTNLNPPSLPPPALAATPQPPPTSFVVGLRPVMPSRLPLSSVTSPLQLDRRGHPVLSTSSAQSSTTTPYPVVRSNPRKAPVPSRTIPKVPEGEAGWKTVVRDWEHADLARSLTVALKDWPREWYSRTQSASTTLGSLRNHRMIIATEFINTYVPLTSLRALLTCSAPTSVLVEMKQPLKRLTRCMPKGSRRCESRYCTRVSNPIRRKRGRGGRNRPR
jgi:hypothetical protein